MDNNKRRPVYLNLFRIRLPVGGVASIVHRATGVLLVLLMPLGAWVLQRSLEGEAGFQQARAWVSQGPGKLLVLLALALFVQHFFSGLRHLLLDLDLGVSKSVSRASAWGAFAGTAVVMGLVLILWS